MIHFLRYVFVRDALLCSLENNDLGFGASLLVFPSMLSENPAKHQDSNILLQISGAKPKHRWEQ